jgi:hypothetical protein
MAGPIVRRPVAIPGGAVIESATQGNAANCVIALGFAMAQGMAARDIPRLHGKLVKGVEAFKECYRRLYTSAADALLLFTDSFAKTPDLAVYFSPAFMSLHQAVWTVAGISIDEFAGILNGLMRVCISMENGDYVLRLSESVGFCDKLSHTFLRCED